MAEVEKQTEAPKEHPAMGQIVGYLKDYPFLLITVAGLVILSGILIFEIEKLKEFKWLIYAVVLVPLVIQFFIEFKKMTPGSSQSASPASPYVPAPDTPRPPAEHMPPPSWKAWVSVGIGMLLFGVVAATPEAELHDQDFALGFFVVAAIAAGLAFAARYDVKRNRTGSKGIATTGIVLSILLMLAGLGWMMEKPPTPSAPPTGFGALNNGTPIVPPVFTPPAQPTQPGQTLPEGRFQLLVHKINQVPQAIGGAMDIARQSDSQYAWRVQLTTQGQFGPQAIAYAGQFLNRNGQWFIQVSDSTDPDWDGPEELPMAFVSDGQNLSVRYASEGDTIESAWARAQ